MSFFGNTIFSGVKWIMPFSMMMEGYRRTMIGGGGIALFIEGCYIERTPSAQTIFLMYHSLEAEAQAIECIPDIIKDLFAPYIDFHNAAVYLLDYCMFLRGVRRGEDIMTCADVKRVCDR